VPQLQARKFPSAGDGEGDLGFFYLHSSFLKHIGHLAGVVTGGQNRLFTDPCQFKPESAYDAKARQKKRMAVPSRSCALLRQVTEV